MGYYAKDWSYSVIQSSNRESLAKYFVNIMKQQYNSRYTTKSIYEVVQRLYKEKDEVAVDYNKIKQLRDSLIGTGMNGLDAQMKFDKISFSMSMYSEGEFAYLLRVLLQMYYVKFDRLSRKSKLSNQEKEFIDIFNRANMIRTLDSIVEQCNHLNIQLPSTFITKEV